MEVLLKNREILDMGKALTGLRIQCLDGSCWVTQTGDRRDYILRSGDIFEVIGNGRVLVSALEPTRIGLLDNLRRKSLTSRRVRYGPDCIITQ